MKLIGAIVGGLTTTILMVWGIMSLWSSVIVPLIPQNEYHGLIKLVVGIVCLFLFGGLGFWLIVASSTIVAGLLVAIIPDRLTKR